MNERKRTNTGMSADVKPQVRPVDASRRLFSKASLAAPVVLATLASRPVLGATCLTPSAAGSGNHSQHNPIETGCDPKSIDYWLANTPTTLQPLGGGTGTGLGNGGNGQCEEHSNGNGNCQTNTGQSNLEVVDLTKPWPGTNYKPGDPFHPPFTQGPLYLQYLKKVVDQTTGMVTFVSWTLYEVLSGKDFNGNDLPKDNVVDGAVIGPYFVMGLLNAAAGYYAGIITPIGPDPSVTGIEDEYAHNGFFVPTAGKQWPADTIKAYLSDPGSVF